MSLIENKKKGIQTELDWNGFFSDSLRYTGYMIIWILFGLSVLNIANHKFEYYKIEKTDSNFNNMGMYSGFNSLNVGLYLLNLLGSIKKHEILLFMIPGLFIIPILFGLSPILMLFLLIIIPIIFGVITTIYFAFMIDMSMLSKIIYIILFCFILPWPFLVGLFESFGLMATLLYYASKTKHISELIIQLMLILYSCFIIYATFNNIQALSAVLMFLFLIYLNF